MEQKELPQEVVNEISVRSEKNTDNMGPISREILVSDRRSGYTIGAKIAQSHYEPIISTLKENVRLLAIEAQDVLSEKDTTIKELQAKNEKLTGLLRQLEFPDADNERCLGWYEKDSTGKRVFIVNTEENREKRWQFYKQQKGIE